MQEPWLLSPLIPPPPPLKKLRFPGDTSVPIRALTLLNLPNPVLLTRLCHNLSVWKRASDEGQILEALCTQSRRHVSLKG